MMEFGTKVVPQSKSVGRPFEKSKWLNQEKRYEKPYFFITGYDPKTRIYTVSDCHAFENIGDYYLESDLELYIDELLDG